MPKARFTFRENGSVEVTKGDLTINLGWREIEVFAEAVEKTKLTASQIGLKKDLVKYPYKVF